MNKKPLLGLAGVGDQELVIHRTELRLIEAEEMGEIERYLYLEVSDGEPLGWMMRIDETPVNKVHSLDDLKGGCVCFSDGGECPAEDTLGFEPDELCETSGWFMDSEGDDILYFEAMLCRFEHLGDKQFRVRMQCRLSSFDTKETFDAWADFEVEAQA